MNSELITLEVCIIALGVVLLLADLFMPPERRRFLGYAAIAALGAHFGLTLDRDRCFPYGR